MTRRAPTGIECTCRVFSGGLTARPGRPIVLFISVNDSFTLAADTRIVRLLSATLSDLKAGDYIAVTAKKQPDATLLASMINVFAPSMRGIAAGQFPMSGGNLMTNATIDKVDASGISVSFPNGSAVVKVAPDAKLMKLVDATAADVKEGASVSAVVAGDVARLVTITEASA